MTTRECRIMGYSCFAFGAAFGYFNCPWLSLLFLLGALLFFLYVIFDDFKPNGGGPLSPA